MQDSKRGLMQADPFAVELDGSCPASQANPMFACLGGGLELSDSVCVLHTKMPDFNSWHFHLPIENI